MLDVRNGVDLLLCFRVYTALAESGGFLRVLVSTSKRKHIVTVALLDCLKFSFCVPDTLLRVKLFDYS